MSQLPTVGRTIHYFENDKVDEPMAAIITGVYGDEEQTVDLSAFQRKQASPLVGVKVPHSSSPKRGHWSWPPRV